MTREVLADCESEILRALVEENNRTAEFLAAVAQDREDRGLNSPPLPKKIIIKRRT